LYSNSNLLSFFFEHSVGAAERVGLSEGKEVGTILSLGIELDVTLGVEVGREVGFILGS